MNEQLHIMDIVRDHKLRTISTIATFVIFVSIVTSLLYYYEIQYRCEYFSKEKGFTSINPPETNQPHTEYPPLKEYAKQMLLIPQSYHHIETIYVRNNDHQELFVQSIFSGKTANKDDEILCLKATYSFEGQPIQSPTACL